MKERIVHDASTLHSGRLGASRPDTGLRDDKSARWCHLPKAMLIVCLRHSYCVLSSRPRPLFSAGAPA